MAINPYAFAALQQQLNESERRRAATGSGRQGVTSTQQTLQGPVGVAGNDSIGGTINVGGNQQQTDGPYQIPEKQVGSAAAGGMAAGPYGAIIGAALAKFEENKEREEARDATKLGYQSSFASKLGYPGDELTAMQQAEKLKYDPQVNMLGMREPEWKTKAEYVVAPHHILGNAVKKFFKLPL